MKVRTWDYGCNFVVAEEDRGELQLSNLKKLLVTSKHWVLRRSRGFPNRVRLIYNFGTLNVFVSVCAIRAIYSLAYS